MHPIIPTRGEIYNAIITEGVGKELAGNHLVIIIQNETIKQSFSELCAQIT